MLIPYRVKNPWKKFPFATVTLMGINVLVFLLTSESFLEIRESVVDGYAYQFGISPIINMLWAMFLHADILHLAGNMLFFWVFGPATEDRLGIPRFLLIYFCAGIVGDLLQGIIDSLVAGGSMPGIGASGCIMGIMGAYWFLFPWSTVCVFYWFGWFMRGIWEVQAVWIIGLFILLDVVEGVVYGSGGGVANFAHVGGGVAGVLLCLALRIKRDSEAVSSAKAAHADMKDLTLVSLVDLEIMRRDDPVNLDVIKAMIPQALRMGRDDHVHRAFRDAGSELIEKDPAFVMKYLLKMNGDPRIYRPSLLMRLGQYAEKEADPHKAIKLYQFVQEFYPRAPENELALYRLALCHWEKCHDASQARDHLQQLLERYPFGSLEQPAKSLMQKIR
ncbi:MAG: rhomboid family intramembrane serine protease [Armatimonadota bacterium]